MSMIKTWPGDSGPVGYLKDPLFENFWAYDITYALDIDQYWPSRTTPGTGAVQISELTFNNWTGTVDNGIQRGPIVIRGSDIVPLTDISLSNFDMWTVNGGKLLYQCKNVYGTGYFAAKSTGPSLTASATMVTVTTPPAAYTPAAKPDWAVQGFGVTDSIPVYTPMVLWAPVSPLCALKDPAATSTTAMASSSTSIIKSATPTASHSTSIYCLSRLRPLPQRS
jgi:rhamnogalacturonan hydrolase